MLIGVSYSAVAKTNLGHKRAKWSVSPTHVTTPFSSTLPSLELDSTTSTLRKTPADQIFRPPCTQMISKTSRFSFESTLTNSFLSKHWAVESETLKMSGGRWSWLHGLIQTHSSFITTVASGKFWSSVSQAGGGRTTTSHWESVTPHTIPSEAVPWGAVTTNGSMAYLRPYGDTRETLRAATWRDIFPAKSSAHPMPDFLTFWDGLSKTLPPLLLIPNGN